MARVTRRGKEQEDDDEHAIVVPTSCAALCTKLAELFQRIDDEFETLYDQHPKMLLGPDVVSLVDFWHAAAYLGAAARVLEIKRKARAGQFRRW